MGRSCSLGVFFIFTLIIGPFSCRGNIVLHAFTDILGWAEHELAAWRHSPQPLPEGQLIHIQPTPYP